MSTSAFLFDVFPLAFHGIAASLLGGSLLYHSRRVSKRKQLMDETPTTAIGEIPAALTSEGKRASDEKKDVFVELKGQVVTDFPISLQQAGATPSSPSASGAAANSNVVILREIVTRTYEERVLRGLVSYSWEPRKETVVVAERIVPFSIATLPKDSKSRWRFSRRSLDAEPEVPARIAVEVESVSADGAELILWSRKRRVLRGKETSEIQGRFKPLPKDVRYVTYTQKEEVLPVGQAVYCLGNARQEADKSLTLFKKRGPHHRPFLLSVKSEEELAAELSSERRWMVVLGTGLLIAGIAATGFDFIILRKSRHEARTTRLAATAKP